MFDIGFWEIVLIGVVALFVVGPERFPGMVRKAGYWMGQFRRMASAVKNEFESEVDKAEELQRLLEEQKRIVENNAKVDLTQPAVKPRSQQQQEVEAAPVAPAEKPADSSNQSK